MNVPWKESLGKTNPARNRGPHGPRTMVLPSSCVRNWPNCSGSRMSRVAFLHHHSRHLRNRQIGRQTKQSPGRSRQPVPKGTVRRMPDSRINLTTRTHPRIPRRRSPSPVIWRSCWPEHARNRAGRTPSPPLQWNRSLLPSLAPRLGHSRRRNGRTRSRPRRRPSLASSSRTRRNRSARTWIHFEIWPTSLPGPLSPDPISSGVNPLSDCGRASASSDGWEASRCCSRTVGWEVRNRC